MTQSSAGVTGIVLAGGRAARLGGLDKGLQPFRGRRLIDWVLERLAPQVDEILISANRNLETYARLGRPVLADETDAFRGPLAGLQSGLRAARYPLLLSVPCDAPFLAQDLAPRLRSELGRRDARCAVASVDGRIQPVFSLVHRDLAPQLDAFLASGGRAVHAWLHSIAAVAVPFDDAGAAFSPLNTPEALAVLEARDAR